MHTGNWSFDAYQYLALACAPSMCKRILNLTAAGVASCFSKLRGTALTSQCWPRQCYWRRLLSSNQPASERWYGVHGCWYLDLPPDPGYHQPHKAAGAWDKHVRITIRVPLHWLGPGTGLAARAGGPLPASVVGRFAHRRRLRGSCVPGFVHQPSRRREAFPFHYRALAAKPSRMEVEDVAGSDKETVGRNPPVKGSHRKGSKSNLPSQKSSATAGDEAEACSFSEPERVVVNHELLAWYDCIHRVLPWRRNPHSQLPAASSSQPSDAVVAAPADLSRQAFAYYVWVSEIMLQQTQVVKVIPYFSRWVARWPTVAALADATQEEVNTVWAGLGYYRRAKYLLEGAQYVRDQLGGKFPETAQQLRQVPGVGPYTAAAVASIAFNDGAAAVDGNVVRVLSRLRQLTDPKPSKVHDALAVQLLHPERPGCHNQAMMELGATVCKPANPDCNACPVQSVCGAHQAWLAYLKEGGDPDAVEAPRVTQYPGKVVRAEKKEQHVAVCVVKVLLPAEPGTATTQPSSVSSSQAAKIQGSSSSKKGSKQGNASMSIKSFFKPAPGTASGPGPTSKGDGSAETVQQQQGEQQQQQPAWMTNETEAQMLAAGAQVYYLLTRRPEGGLLAGLWEMPSVVVQVEEEEEEAADEQQQGDCTDAAAAAAAAAAGGGGGPASGGRDNCGQAAETGSDADKQRDQQQLKTKTAGARPTKQQKKSGKDTASQQQQQQQQQGSSLHTRFTAAAFAYLEKQLGVVLPGPSTAAAAGPGAPTVQLVRRSRCGSAVHIFSHIRQTLHVELLVLAARSLQDVCPAAQVAAVGDAAAAAPGDGAAAGTGDDPPSAAAAEGAAGKKGAKGNTKAASSSKKRRASEADNPAAAASTPLAMRWVAGGDLLAQGLTSGVRKVLGLVKA